MIVFSRLSKGVISERGKLIHCQPLESMTKVDEGQKMSRAHQRAMAAVEGDNPGNAEGMDHLSKRRCADNDDTVTIDD